MVVLFEQRAVQADDVGLAEQGIEIHVLGSQLDGCRILVRIVDQQANPEALEDAQSGQTDLAGADDANGLAMHVEADQPFQREVGIAGALISLMDAAVEAHHHADSMLGGRLGGVGGHSHHFQPQLFGSGQIHVVVTGAAQGNHLGAVGSQFGQYLAVGIVIDEQTHHREAVSQSGRFGLQPHIEKLQIEAVLAVGLVEMLFVIALGTEYGDFHGMCSAACVSSNYNKMGQLSPDKPAGYCPHGIMGTALTALLYEPSTSLVL